MFDGKIFLFSIFVGVCSFVHKTTNFISVSSTVFDEMVYNSFDIFLLYIILVSSIFCPMKCH